MERILAQAKKMAEEAEVFQISSEETQVRFEANRLKQLQTKQQTSVALRIIRQGKIGYATATELENSQNLVNMAVETAQFGMGAEFEFPSLSTYPQVEILDSGVESVSTEEMTKLGTGYFLTTPIFDVDKFAKFIKRVDTFGVPVIAEVMILRTAGMGSFLNRHLKSGLVPEWIIQKLAQAPDKQKASTEIFADIVSALKDLCQGVHIITIGGEEKLKYYLDAAKLK